MFNIKKLKLFKKDKELSQSTFITDLYNMPVANLADFNNIPYQLILYYFDKNPLTKDVALYILKELALNPINYTSSEQCLFRNFGACILQDTIQDSSFINLAIDHFPKLLKYIPHTQEIWLLAANKNWTVLPYLPEELWKVDMISAFYINEWDKEKSKSMLKISKRLWGKKNNHMFEIAKAECTLERHILNQSIVINSTKIKMNML